MKLELAGLRQFLDISRHALADTGDLEKLFDVFAQLGYLTRMTLESFGRATVGADTKRVVAVDLHEIGGFVEDGGDGFVVHGACWRKLYRESSDGRMHGRSVPGRCAGEKTQPRGLGGKNRKNVWPTLLQRWRLAALLSVDNLNSTGSPS